MTTPNTEGRTLGQILFESENPFPLARSWDDCHVKVKANYERDAQAVAQAAVAERDAQLAKLTEENRRLREAGQFTVDCFGFDPSKPKAGLLARTAAVEKMKAALKGAG